MRRREGFAGRTAVVTGAGGGMGLQVALGLQEAGALVVGIDVKERPAELGEALYEQGDVSDERFVGDAMARAFAANGRLDHLVNAAGVLLFGQDRSLTEIELRRPMGGTTGAQTRGREEAPHLWTDDISIKRPTAEQIHDAATG